MSLFAQVVISRHERAVGMNYGARLIDEGCVDSQYSMHVAEAMARGETYSAEERLQACFSEDIVRPVLRFWSYRFDDSTHSRLELGPSQLSDRCEALLQLPLC